jgi:hypothetical protein
MNLHPIAALLPATLKSNTRFDSLGKLRGTLMIRGIFGLIENND